MLRQLEFWTPEQPLPRWEDFEAEERIAVIALLVRMITKSVCPKLAHQKEENPDEP